MKQDEILNSAANAHTKQMAFDNNRRKLLVHQRQLFGKRQRQLPTAPLDAPMDTPVETDAPVDAQVDAPVETDAQVDAPVESDEALKEPELREKLVDEPPAATFDDTEEISDDDLNVSQNTQQRYLIKKELSRMIEKQVPRTVLWTDDDGAVYYEGEKIKNSNIDGILNYLTTPNSNVVAGGGRVMHTLLRVPGFNPDWIQNKKAFERFMAANNQYPRPFTQKELRGGGEKSFVVIKKLPFVPK